MKVWRIGIIVMLLLVGTIGPVLAQGQGQGKKPGEPVDGTPLYPDLVTLVPTNLSFDQVTMSNGLVHYVLRFNNTVANRGVDIGRLELEGQKRSKIYQNVYDAPVGGNLIKHIYVGNDSIFHEGHNHYHIENFASYVLIQNGRELTRGTKTSFCVMDVVQLDGLYNTQYGTCGRSIQGLTVGWGDTYYASLAEQWIDLGTSPLPDGTYTLQSTADPVNMFTEVSEVNNSASTCFTVTGDNISVVPCY